MASVTLYGFAPSTYVRTARLCLEEKGVDYSLEEPANGPAHPFGKIPSLKHGDFTLFETLAIGRYVDEAFDGPALQPDDPATRATMTQWSSILLDYIYGTVVRGLVIPRLVHARQGKPVDEEAIRTNLPKVAKHLEVLDGGVAASDYFAGAAPSIADWLIEPVITYVSFTPEGKDLLAKTPSLSTWHGRMAGRNSFKATLPEM